MTRLCKDLLARVLVLALVLLLSQATLHGDEAVSEDKEDPCEQLLVVMSSDDADGESQSKLLDLSLEKFDECLDILLLGSSGSTIEGDSQGTLGATEELSESSESVLTSPEGDSTSLDSSLKELDSHLANVKIELEPMDQQSGNPSDSPSQIAHEQHVSQDGASDSDTEQSTPPDVSPDDQTPETTSSTSLQGEQTSNAKHSKTNRQPADPKHEDELLKQLREAAEKEKDPQTKEALWDQYYEYLDNKK